MKTVDSTTKIIVTILSVVITFLVTFLLLSELLVEEQIGGGMMGHMNDPDYTIPIIVSLSTSLIIGLVTSLLLKTQKPETIEKKTDELEIIKRALSDDEKTVLDEIRRAGEITQDSLRFRLEWSKAKLSRILTNLDKMNIIQRERVGKTYKVFITGEQPEK